MILFFVTLTAAMPACAPSPGPSATPGAVSSPPSGPRPSVIHAPLAAASPPPRRPPDGTYRYSVTVSGVPIANSTVVISSERNGVRVRDAIGIPLESLRGTATALYDTGTLRQVGYTADLDVQSRPQHTDVTFGAGFVTIATRNERVTVRADAGAPLELISDNFPGTALMIPAILQASKAHAVTLAVTRGGRAVLATVKGDAHPERPAGVPKDDLSLTLTTDKLTLNYWYDPANDVVAALDVPEQNALLELTSRNADVATVSPPPIPSPVPTPRPRFASRNVTFASADGTLLAGTVTVPDSDTSRAPAVVLVAGSGPQNRDEAIGPNPVFLQLSNALSNAGYVVLRYDKRGVAQSGGNAASETRGDLLHDVSAAYRFLRSQPYADPQHVYLLGHSEGGELVPTVAAASRGVAGIVLMAPPALPLREIIMQQTLASVSPGKRASAAVQEQRFLSDVQDGKHTGPGMPWLRSSLAVDPASDIARVRVPILILQGGQDVQVRAHDLPRLVAAARAQDPDVTVRVFPDDDHLFMPVAGHENQTPLSALHRYVDVAGYIDERVLTTLVDWLDAHSAATSATAARDSTAANLNHMLSKKGGRT